MSGINVSIGGTNRELKDVLNDSTGAVVLSTKQWAAAFGEGTDKAGGSIAKLSDFLKEHQKEHASTARAVNAFSRELTGIIGPADGAAKALGGMLGALRSGNLIIIAIEAIKSAIELYKAEMEAAKKKAEELAKAQKESAREMAEAWKTLRDIVAETQALMAGGGRASELLKADLKNEDERHKILEKQVEVREKLKKAQEKGPEPGAGPINDLTQAVEAYQKAYLASFEKQRAERAEIDRKWDEKEAAEAQRKADKEKGLADRAAAERKRTAGEVEAFVAAQAESGLTGRAKIYAETDKLYAEINKNAERMTAAEVAREVAAVQAGEAAKIKAYEKTLAERQLTLDVAQTKHAEDEKARAMEQAHERAIRILHEQKTEQQKTFMEGVRNAEQLGSAFGDAFVGIAAGTKSVGQAFAQVAQQIVAIVTQMMIKTVTAHAAEAGAGAAASQAGIPIFGPVLAIAAMGAMVSAVLGLIASASGGYDIPGGVNPLVQAHGGEMILPAPLADRVRDMTGGGGGLTVHFSPQITAMDGKDVYRTLTNAQTGFARFLEEGRRAGRW